MNEIKQNEIKHLTSKILKRVIAFSILPVVLVACNTNEPQVRTDEQTNVAAKEVAANPDRYIGQTVTIRSEPIRKFDSNSFTVKDERVFGSEPILIVNASGKPFVLPTDGGTEVQITGEVRKFVVADVDKEYNLGLEPNTYREYENKPVIIARSVALSPKPGEITKNPEQYYGKTLAVAGEVKDIPSTTAFTLEDNQLFGGEDLLVLHIAPQATPSRPVKDGEKVAVTGILRPFVITEFERDYSLTWSLDLKQKLEAEYKNKPVLIATGVYPSAIPQSAQ